MPYLVLRTLRLRSGERHSSAPRATSTPCIHSASKIQKAAPTRMHGTSSRESASSIVSTMPCTTAWILVSISCRKIGCRVCSFVPYMSSDSGTRPSLPALTANAGTWCCVVNGCTTERALRVTPRQRSVGNAELFDRGLEPLSCDDGLSTHPVIGPWGLNRRPRPSELWN